MVVPEENIPLSWVLQNNAGNGNGNGGDEETESEDGDGG